MSARTGRRPCRGFEVAAVVGELWRRRRRRRRRRKQMRCPYSIASGRRKHLYRLLLIRLELRWPWAPLSQGPSRFTVSIGSMTHQISFFIFFPRCRPCAHSRHFRQLFQYLHAMQAHVGYSNGSILIILYCIHTSCLARDPSLELRSS